MIWVVQNLLLNYCFSVAILTFYRRSFKRENVPQFLCFLVEGILTFVWGHTAVIVGTLTISVCLSTYKWRSNMKFRHSFLLVFFSIGIRKSTAGGGTADQLARTRHRGPVRSVLDTIHQKTPVPEEQDATAASFHGACVCPL